MATTLEFIEEGNRTGRIFDRIRIKRKKAKEMKRIRWCYIRCISLKISCYKDIGILQVSPLRGRPNFCFQFLLWHHNAVPYQAFQDAETRALMTTCTGKYKTGSQVNPNRKEPKQ